MTTTRVFIDTNKMKFEAVIKHEGNNPNIVRDGAVVSSFMLNNFDFKNITEYVLNSYPKAEIVYCEL